MAVYVRAEQVGDEQAIHDLAVAAFEPMPFSDGSEAAIIDELRKDGDLVISLVAFDDSRIVGHIAFSPVTIGQDGGGWYGLGPVSVRPDLQKSGIGSQLIIEGLSILKSRGAKGCALVDDPNYYTRFGFQSDGKISYRNLPLQYVQWLSFVGQAASVKLTFSRAFER